MARVLQLIGVVALCAAIGEYILKKLCSTEVGKKTIVFYPNLVRAFLWVVT